MNADEKTNDLKEQVLLSENLFTAFNRLVQAVRIHQDNNQLVIQSAEYFIHAINRCGADESHLTIQIISGRFLSAAGKGSLSSRNRQSNQQCAGLL